MPTVSVIIPTFNRAGYIADAIQSAQAQDHCDVEIIVADDGSTDNTAEIVAQFAPRTVYMRLPHRGQPAATRNGGLCAARGEFVAFLDSDDLFLPGKLALQLAAFSAHPEAALVYANGYFFRDRPDEPLGYLLDGLPVPSGHIFAELLRGNFVFTPAVLVKRACLDVVGRFDERPDFFAVEDYDLWLRIAGQFPVVYTPGNVAAVRRHGKSISSDIAALRRRELRVLAKMDTLYPTLMSQYRDARHEAYARNHGAIAMAEFRQGHKRSGLFHTFKALRHTLPMPGLGRRAVIEWWIRRHLRERAMV